VRQNLLDLRWITAILLFLLLLNSFFYCLYYNICIWQRQASVKASIANSTYGGRLTIIKMPTASSNLTQNEEDEITVGGMLYDVVKRQTLHDTVFLYTLPDDEEQQLVEKINAYVNAGAALHRGDGTALHPVLQPIKFLPLVYVHRLVQGNCYVVGSASKQNSIASSGCTLSYPDIPSPPPKALYSSKIIYDATA